MAEGYRSVRVCNCAERRHLQALARFNFDADRNGWVFPDDLRRSMSANAKYGAFVERARFPHRDFTGQPFTWVECPFCFCALPFVKLEPDVHPHPVDDGPESL